MSGRESTLGLDAIGDDFLLTKVCDDGARIEVTLSSMEVLKLAQSALRAQQHILARLSRANAIASVRIPVNNISATVDLHGDDVLLDLMDPGGVAVPFLLDLDVASVLTTKLTAVLDQIRAARRGRIQQ
jgi:hypothetical protein